MSRPHIALDICTITYIQFCSYKDTTIIPIPNIQNFLGIYRRRRRLIGRKVINMY